MHYICNRIKKFIYLLTFKTLYMSDETQVLINYTFYYYDNNGKKYTTPNASFAEARAYYYGTETVYIEKY